MTQFKRLIIPYFIWAIVILVIPLFLIALYAFTTEGNEVMTLSFTWGNFAKFLEATYLNVILKSFWLGLLTTFICLVLGYPLALIIARCSEKVQGLLIMLVTIPMWINMLLRTYAWMNLLADNGIINNLLAKIGLGPISMMYTDFSVMVGLICNFMPFMIIPIHTSLNKMDKSLIEAAYDLGANRFQTFWKVIWKLSLPGVVNGIMMVFLLAISSFVIPKLLGGGQYMLIGNLIESPGFYPNLTATENLQIFAELRGLKGSAAIKSALELVGLPYRDKKLFSQYSLGMKQRLAIALSVMHNPELLILDEPINGLDPIGIAEVRSFIRELCDAQGKTILISSHILSEVALLADDIGIIDHGVLLEEESLAELQQKNRHYIHFTVSDSEKAAHILAMAFKTRNYKICDSYNIQLMDASMPVAAINRAFIQNGLEVSEAHLCEDTLEDYFKEVTGGEGIA